MRQFLEIFKYEFKTFVDSKWYKVSTLLICVLVAGAMFLPHVIDMGNKDDNKGKNVSETSSKFGIYDPNHVFKDESVLKAGFPKATFTNMTSEKDLQQGVQEKTIDAGFAITSTTTYSYLIMDSIMSDTNKSIFNALMNAQYRSSELGALGLDANKINSIINTPIKSETKILGVDGVKNYMYTYILVFGLYFIIIFYGQMTATGVASEKGNRAIEILITSANPNALIFGKVLAGAIAGILQAGVLLGVSYGAYQINAEVWNHALDFIFNIPINVLLTFGVFGTLGYLFYSFIYGAFGAMVSKVEEVGSAISPITIIFVLSFFITFYTMSDPQSLLGTIASYLPFSSCMAMFARVAMGSVGIFEVLLSAGILLVSTIVMGLIGAKLYRRGTLMYGNTFKISNVLKELKKKN
ncbi:MAG: ABC transporter permease [Longicatena sp.]